MKKTLFFIGMLMLVTSAFSQIQLRNADSSITYNNGDTINIQADNQFDFFVYNNTDSQVSCTGRITAISIPADAAGVQFCALGTCSVPTDTMQLVTRNIDSDSSMEADIKYLSDGSTETFYMSVKFYDANNVSDSIAVTFLYKAPSFVRNINEDKKIQIAPNPANDMAKISFEQNNSNTAILYNINGEIIQQIPLNSVKGNFYMNTAYLSDGLYIIKIGNSNRKFIVRH